MQLSLQLVFYFLPSPSHFLKIYGLNPKNNYETKTIPRQNCFLSSSRYYHILFPRWSAFGLWQQYLWQSAKLFWSLINAHAFIHFCSYLWFNCPILPNNFNFQKETTSHGHPPHRSHDFLDDGLRPPNSYRSCNFLI